MKKIYVSAAGDIDIEKLTEFCTGRGVDAFIPALHGYAVASGEEHANWLKRHSAELNIRVSDELWIFGEIHGEALSDWQYAIHIRKLIRCFDQDFKETEVLEI